MNSYNSSKCQVPGRRVLVNDTTLRDGNQSAYGTMYNREKIAIALQLEKIGVDIIEAGFAASNGNSDVMREIAQRVKRPYLSGLSRGKKEDIYATYRALRNYDKRMIHIFIPTSEIQVKAKFNKAEKEILRVAVTSVKFAKKYFDCVEFTAEDTTRSDVDFLKKIYAEVIDAGANVINIADTVGCEDPWNFGCLVQEISNYIRSLNPITRIGVHCHNDRGLALANTLAGIRSGADIVEATVNGLGERCGNCALESLVANSIVENSFFTTGINPKEIYKASKMVFEATKVRNDMAPIVGKTAFAHKSGIHQHGMSNDKKSYEIFDPETFGRKSEIIIGPHSGYHGMIAKAEELGFNISERQARKAIDVVSEMVKKEVMKRFSDKDLKTILQKVIAKN